MDKQMSPRKRNNDEFNKLSKFAVTLSILVALTAVFAYIWFWIDVNLVEIWSSDIKNYYLAFASCFNISFRVQIEFYKAWDILYNQTLIQLLLI